jgi:hypothetical protein
MLSRIGLHRASSLPHFAPVTHAGAGRPRHPMALGSAEIYIGLQHTGRRRAAAMARYASGFLASIGVLIAPLLEKKEK